MIGRRCAHRSSVWLLPFALFACGGCKSSADKADEPIATVQVVRPTTSAISDEITADAILAPLSQAAIAPRISAPILHEYVERGQHVHQGQLLVTLQDRELFGAAVDSRGAVTSAQAAYTTVVNATIPEDVKKAETDVAQARASSEVATRTATERKKLFDQGALAGRDADVAFAAAAQAQAAYDVAVRHLESVMVTTQKTSQESAEGLLTSAKGKLTSSEAQVGFARLRSPINGVVTERPLFPGETAQSGATVITVMDTSSLLAKLHLAQSSAQKLQVGDKAEVRVPGLDDSVEGKVAFISPALDPGSTTVELWVKIANTKGSLKAGTPVQATVSGTLVKDAMQVPASAIVPGTDGNTAVVVVDADGTVHKKLVKVGIRKRETVQILSGLSPNDSVITEGGYGLDDGTKVKTVKPGAGNQDNSGKASGDKN